MSISRRDLFKALAGTGLAALLPKMAAAKILTPSATSTAQSPHFENTAAGWPRTQLTQELIDDAMCCEWEGTINLAACSDAEFAEYVRAQLDRALHDEAEREFLCGLNGGGIGNPIGILG